MLGKNFNIGDIINTNTGQIKIISLAGAILYRAPNGDINEDQLYCVEYNGQTYFTSDMGLRSKDTSIFDRIIANIGYRGYIDFRLFKKEYEVWKNMLYRCYWHNSNIYPYYGAIGITVDPRWHSFEMFLYDIFETPNYDKMIEGKTVYELDLSVKQKNIHENQRIYTKGKVTLRPFYLTDVATALDKAKNKGNTTKTCYIEPVMQQPVQIQQPVFSPNANGAPTMDAYNWIINNRPNLNIPSLDSSIDRQSLLNAQILYNKLSSGTTMDNIIKENLYYNGGDKK